MTDKEFQAISYPNMTKIGKFMNQTPKKIENNNDHRIKFFKLDMLDTVFSFNKHDALGKKFETGLHIYKRFGVPNFDLVWGVGLTANPKHFIQEWSGRAPKRFEWK